MAVDTSTLAPPLLEMEGVSVAATDGREGEMLEGVTWTVREGDYWAVGGRQGTGKTELLAIAAGLSRPNTGSVQLFGRDIIALEAEEWLAERLRIGFVFSDGGRVFNHMTVAQNISLPLCYHYDSDDADMEPEVERFLNAVGVAELRDEYPAAISPAWRQRVALARALALKPELLLLDNPTSGLDFVHTEWWLQFLAELARGHSVFGGKRVTLVVAVSALRPWLKQATHFALLHEKKWHVIGGRSEWEASADPLVHEMAD